MHAQARRKQGVRVTVTDLALRPMVLLMVTGSARSAGSPCCWLVATLGAAMTSFVDSPLAIATGTAVFGIGFGVGAVGFALTAAALLAALIPAMREKVLTDTGKC